MAVPYYNGLLDMYASRELRKAQRARIRDMADPFQVPDREFVSIFRTNKDMAHYVIRRLQADLEPIGVGPPAHIKVLLSIQLLANGGYTRPLGQDHTVCVAQTTVSKYIGQFAESAYRRLFAEWVHFPGNEEARNNIAQGFNGDYGVPGVLGCIDCTHVKIFPPPGPQGDQYKNRRKSAHTLNVQLVSNADCRILNVNARFPGRVHDPFIYRQSNVREEMKKLHHRGHPYFLLGDSGYPMEPWLMTPILHANPGTPESRYTEWHCRVRNGVERTNGYLKGTLRCLGIDRVLHYAPEKASLIIYTSCILYNIMKHFGVPLIHEAEVRDNDEEPQEMAPVHLLRLGQARRTNIVQTHFLENV